MENKKLSARNFYELVKSGNDSEINRISRIMVSRMALYLRSVMRVEDELAMDCAQQAFENFYEKILEDSLTDIDNIFGYLIISVKNEYLMRLRREKFEVPSDYAMFIPIQDTSSENIFEVLYSKEREKKLEKCIRELKFKNRKFFKLVLEYINENDKETAKMIGMSYSNFRTKKSRIIDALKECVKNSNVVN
ncbi:MAG: sigma-70 family RNA polymerase sigma factor [Balneolaceae bacterium]|nr:sigma-70 family RNA polymerase sigma factor [Balneolaceae bacterium]